MPDPYADLDPGSQRLPARPERLRALLASLGIAALTFAVYAYGSCRTIYVGDSGELVTAVHGLGIPHPTGYPLYVLLGKLWTLAVPFGSIAWRMSLFSALCAAATCGVLHAVGRRAGLQSVAAATAALVLAFSPSFWSQATIQRVYALGALFVVLATAAGWRWHRLRSPRALALAFFVCGLGATNHTIMAVYALGFAIFAAAVEPSLVRRPGRIAAVGAAFAAGLLPYAYLPWRSRQDPLLDWGNPETLRGFFDVVLRREFWDRAWVESPADLLAVAGNWALGLGQESAWIGAALALLGLVAGARRSWPVGLFVLVMLGNVTAMALHGSRADLFIWHRYYIPSYVMLALLAGLGSQVLIERLPRRARVLPLVLPAFLVVAGFQAHDRSYVLAEAFSEDVLRALPPGAHLIASDDNVLYVLMYLHWVEGRRPDVDLILQGVSGIERPPLRFDPEREPLFLVDHPNWQLASLEIVPVGVVFRAWRAGGPSPPLILPADHLPGETDPRVPKDYLTRCLIGHFHYMLGVTFEQRDWLRARRELEAVTAFAPDSDVLQYNLGLIFRRNGLLDDASAAFERADAANPRPLQSASRPRASDRLAELRAERERLATLEAHFATDPALRALEPGTPAYHERLAGLLEARGETLAARGHRLRALEKGGAPPAVSWLDPGPGAGPSGQRR